MKEEEEERGSEGERESPLVVVYRKQEAPVRNCERLCTTELPSMVEREREREKEV